MTFSLSRLQDVYPTISQAMLAAWEAQGKTVAKVRKYYDGDHDASYLTTEMKKLLRLTDSSSIPFAANYCRVIVNTFVDRLNVTGIRTDDETTNQWIADLLIDNRFDAMQTQVHEASILDGDSYLMVSYDSKAQRAVMTHEYAWDGTSGMLALYRSRSERVMECAIKIWELDQGNEDVLTRVNLYYPDHIERYACLNNGNLEPYAAAGLPAAEVWINQRTGEPIGIPVVHFRNGGRYNTGVSEIGGAIPIQDAHNRTWYSLVLASEYTGFSVLFALGFDPGADLRPGSMVTALVNGEPPDNTMQIDLRRIEAGSCAELLNVAQYEEGVMGRITRTPSPEFISPVASGEARKQAEVGLVGKVKRFQVNAGNGWEDAVKLAAQVQTAYGQETAPEFERLTTQWQNPELRNDVEVVDNTVKTAPFVDKQTTLEGFAPVFSWDSDKIAEIMERIEDEQAQQTENALAQMPNFNRFDDQFADNGQARGNGAQPMMQRANGGVSRNE